MSGFALQALSIAQGFSSELLGLFVSLLATLILYFFRLRPKLVFGRPHSSRHVLNLADTSKGEQDNPLEIYNEQFFIANQGRRAAKQVDVVLSDFPRNISVHPLCDWSYKRVEGSGCQVTIPYIAAGELITLDCIYLNQKAAFICAVRSEESIGRPINFWTVQKFSNTTNLGLFVLLVLGAAFVIQFFLPAFFWLFAQAALSSL